MSAVLDRAALEESPLADLHLLANQLGLDGFRRLRKAELVEQILERQGGDAPAPSDEVTAEAGDEAPKTRRSRSRRSKAQVGGDETAEAEEAAAEAAEVDEEDDADAGRSRRRGRRGGRGRAAAGDADDNGAGVEEKVVEGVVELLANGSGFVRLTPPENTDDDVYVSAAQVKRCELVSGDRVGGPVRPPRRSERYPSLVRVDTINGRPAEEVAEGTRFEDLPASFPTERLALGDDDPTVKAIEWLTPFGRGSRVTVVGAARAGKTEALRRIARALSGQEGLDVSIVLAGTRPEEIGEWTDRIAPAAAVTFSASAEAQAHAIEQVVEQGRRVAARGQDAVVIVDSLEYVAPAAARRVLGAARNLTESGSLTVIAAAPAPVGGETTVVALDAALTALGRFPSLDLAASGTLRPDLLVGEAGAEAIARARAESLGAN